MLFTFRAFCLAIVSFILGIAQAQTAAKCSPTLTPKFPLPSVAPGYVVRLVANGLTGPRKIHFDSAGHLLVLEKGVGVTSLTFKDSGKGCLNLSSRKIVVANIDLNHGLELSADSKTLYASDVDKVYKWTYAPATQKVTSSNTTIVSGMYNLDHPTRSLLLSKRVPGMMVVNRGSAANLDFDAESLATGRSQVRAFNIANTAALPYNFSTTGTLLGWGLRNEVGLAEHPTTGGLYGVENSVDNLKRNGVDVHQTNPAEELNFFGYLNGTVHSNQGSNFGYPDCFTAWDTSVISNWTGTVGQQFSNDSTIDTACASRTNPRLAFHPHNAPLDILFNNAGTTGWITFHGSWNQAQASGYALGKVTFQDGQPVDPSTSTTAVTYIAQSKSVTTCSSSKCWRPVGLAWDSKGRLFMSSDATGEIYAIEKTDGSGINN